MNKTLMYRRQGSENYNKTIRKQMEELQNTIFDLLDENEQLEADIKTLENHIIKLEDSI